MSEVLELLPLHRRGTNLQSKGGWRGIGHRVSLGIQALIPPYHPSPARPASSQHIHSIFRSLLRLYHRLALLFHLLGGRVHPEVSS